jgi:hypothetical protein
MPVHQGRTRGEMDYAVYYFDFLWLNIIEVSSFSDVKHEYDSNGRCINLSGNDDETVGP